MSSYSFRRPPRRHQRAALKQLLSQGYGGALLCEPRTGKTKVTVDWLSVLSQQGKIDRALVVCPNRVMGVWLTELMVDSPRRVHVTVWDAAERRLGPPRTPPGYDLYVVVTNYEAFATPGRKTRSGRRSKASGRFKARAMVERWRDGRPAAMVLDESHKIKSPSGKSSNMIVGMGPKFSHRLILTGTPLTKAKRAHDVYMQWQFLNPERFADLPTVAEFKARYGRWMQKNGYPQYLGPRNMRELHARMSRDAFIVRRDQCFDLPPREDVVELVELGPSRPAYQQMAEEMVARLEDGSTAEASIKIVQALRLGQITSGFVTSDDGELRRVGFEKYDRMVEVVGERLEQDQKVVVAARWRADLDLVEEFGRSSRVPTFSVRGRIKRADSDRAIREFTDLDGAGIMVIQPSAAALGIDLSSASLMVWYSHTPSWVDFSQCCDRIALSRTSTTFVHLVARGTVDEVVLSVLAGDGDVGRAIMSHPGELVDGRPLDLDDYSRLRGLGSFQPRDRRKR